MMKLEKAIDIFIVSKTASGYSPHTLAYYRIYINRLSAFLGNPEINDIKPEEMTQYFLWLRNDYIPMRMSGKSDKLSMGALKHNWAVIRSFFSFAEEEIPMGARPDLHIKAPRDATPTVIPFSKEDVMGLLYAVEYSKEAETNRRSRFAYRRPTRRRDKAIILSLLDTGIRVGELTRITIDAVHLPRPQDKIPGQADIEIRPYLSGRKSRGRMVHISPPTIKSVMLYLAEDRGDMVYDEDPLFVSSRGRKLTRSAVRAMIRRAGERAGVEHAHPHRFRHTFAIEYLRNNGDPYALPDLLGHNSMEMTKRYLRYLRVDLKDNHRVASPVSRWRL